MVANLISWLAIQNQTNSCQLDLLEVKKIEHFDCYKNIDNVT